MTRYPIEALAQALGITLGQTGRHHNDPTHPEGLTALAQALHITERRLQRTRTQGGWRHREADTYATRTGHHPANIWPHWDTDIPDHLTDADWYTDDPPLDQLDDPPANPPPLPGIMVA